MEEDKNIKRFYFKDSQGGFSLKEGSPFCFLKGMAFAIIIIYF